MCEKWFEPIIKLKNKIKSYLIHNFYLNQQVLNFCKLFDIFYSLYFEEKIPNYKNEKVLDLVLINIEKTFVYTMIWTLGMDLDQQGRIKFDQLVRDIEGVFPFSQQIFDYYLNFDKFEFFLWEQKLTITP